jgi:hypothetical protein
MKMVLLVIDSARREELEVALDEAGVGGYTELPHAAGRGETGPRLGSRAFPRTSAVVFTFVADDALAGLRRKLQDFCAACGERLRFVAWDAEEFGPPADEVPLATRR